MKKIIAAITSLLVFLLIGTGDTRAQDDVGWVINSFDSQINLDQETGANIFESIEVDFKSMNKHGIYREIPVRYTTKFGNKFDIDFQLLSVTDDKDREYETEISKSGNNIIIKIGDPKYTVSGINTYNINYQVKNVVLDQNENAEFYWNVTGDNWPVPILSSTARLNVPDEKILNSTCFTGPFGSTAKNCSFDNGYFQTSNISPGDGFTLSVQLNKKQFSFPSVVDKFIAFVKNNLIYLLPFVVFGILLSVYWRKGRDEKYKNIFYEKAGVDFVSPFEKVDSQMVFGPPKNLSPGEVGLLVDEIVHSRDVTSIVIDLARRGYFVIKEIQKGKVIKSTDYELILLGKEESNLHNFEISVIDMLFGKERNKNSTLSLLPKDSYKFQKEIKDRLYDHLVSSGYFSNHPDKVRNKYLIIGILIIFTSFFISPTLSMLFYGVNPTIPLVLSGVVVIVFAKFMPARSAKGRKVLAEIVGLREYVRVGAWRQKKYEGWNYFEEILPYTISFGLTHKFIDAFEKAKIKKPDWYQSNAPFDALRFSSAMSNFDGNLSAGINATRPKASSGGSGFGGGGFSGGGFGGGGGGSW